MKRVLYSNPVKFAAVILCALCVAVAVHQFADNFFDNNDVYMFEKSYEESIYARHIVEEEFYELSRQLERTRDEYGNGGATPISREEFDNIHLHPENLSNLPHAGDWEYYIKVNGKVYTNVDGETSYSDFQNSPLSFGMTHSAGMEVANQGFSNPSNGWYYINDMIYSPADDYAVCLRMPQSVIDKNNAEWQTLQYAAHRALIVIIILLSASTALFIYLLCATGRKYGTKEIQLMLIDRMLVELTIILFLGILIGGLAAILAFWYEFIFNGSRYVGNMENTFVGVITFAVIALSIPLLLSIIRNMKNRTFLKRSLIYGIILWVWKWAKAIFRFIYRGIIRGCDSLRALFGRRSGMIMAVLLIAYTILAAINPIVAVVMFAFGCLFIGTRTYDFDKIKNGVREFKKGNFAHKIEYCRSEDYKAVANDLNEIGEGMAAAVEERVKAERMKSELITNISHDLKTPLTSIINYADLLSKEQLTPAEANDYVRIIQKKGERLKRLTNDLFDISKVQSGNGDFVIEDIDLCLLVEQEMAELNESIKKSGLKFIVNSSDKEVIVRADGKKMSRVFENLFVNCVKYAMADTRVYVDITRTDTESIVEIKNIAGYEMNFNEDEIAERFVRGDSARTSEGSGLGLAIVKSYVEGCGGRFEIKKDGDLFKAIIIFS